MAAKTGTYTLIDSTTLSTSATSVTFSSIPGTYTDLVVVIRGTLVSTGNGIFVRVNSDTATNYSTTNINGNGTSATSSRHTNNSNGMHIGSWQGGASASPMVSISHFLDYANTTTFKTMVNRCSDPGSGVDAQVGLWRSTSAITSLTFRSDNTSNSFASGCNFRLYGIEAGNL